MAGIPAWSAVRVLQWVLFLVALAGAVWLGVLAVMGYLQAPVSRTPEYRGVPLPTLLLVGGAALGIVLAAALPRAGRVGARARAGRADQRLRGRRHRGRRQLVVAPDRGRARGLPRHLRRARARRAADRFASTALLPPGVSSTGSRARLVRWCGRGWSASHAQIAKRHKMNEP